MGQLPVLAEVEARLTVDCNLIDAPSNQCWPPDTAPKSRSVSEIRNGNW